MNDNTKKILIIAGIGIVVIALTSFVIVRRRKKTDKTKNYIIGDSQTPFIDNASEKALRIKTILL